MVTIEITGPDTGKTVLEILVDRIPTAPRSYLRRLLRSGKVRCKDRALTEDDRPHDGEILLLPDSGRLREFCASALPPLDILLETDDFIVVFKPAGLAVHSSVGHEGDNLTARVRARMQHRKVPYKVAPVHRLDVGTSGPVLFGKGRKAIARFGQLLQSGDLRKFYLALVYGTPPEAGTMTGNVRVQGKTKQAATRFRVLGRHGHTALLELELLSGRKHQIRQQCADAGWPLYGDGRYGGPAMPGADRLFLHCRQLAWPADDGKEPCCVSCPLPGDLCEILARLHIGPPPPPDR